MNSLLVMALSNVVVASVMALFVVGVSRIWRRPAVIHSLWLLVLLKLITPPVFKVSVAVAWWETPREAGSAAVAETSDDAAVKPPQKLQPRLAGDSSTPDVSVPILKPAESPDATTPPAIETAIVAGGAIGGPAGSVKPGSKAAAPKTADDVSFVPIKGGMFVAGGDTPSDAITQPQRQSSDVLPPTTIRREVVPAETPRETAGARNSQTVADASPATTQPRFRTSSFPFLPILVGVWLAGTIFYGITLLLRILVFRNLIAQSETAPPELQRQTRELANRLGVARPPEVRLLTGSVSPMLWAGGRRAKLLFPRGLLGRMNTPSRSTLLLHELAHMRRGDHWVRFLEVLTACLYWWNPVVWWARREIHRTEEECCDALVVEHSGGGRIYAAALLQTLDFLADSLPPENHRGRNKRRHCPPVASGIGGVEFLRHRLTMILAGSVRGKLPRSARAVILALAVFLLPLLPTFAQRSVEESERETGPETASRTTSVQSDESSEGKPRRPVVSPTIGGGEPTDFETKPRSLTFTPLEVRSLDTTRDGRWMVSGHGRWTTGGRVRVWDLKANKEVASFPEPKGIAAVAFSPDGKLLASVGWNDVLRIRNMPSLKQRHAIPLDDVARLAFSPDGKTLATATESQKLQLWDPRTGKEKESLPGTYFRMQNVTFSPDGRYLAVCGGKFNSPRDGRLAVWDLKTRKQIKVIDNFSAPLLSVAFSPDGKTLVAAGIGRQIYAWKLPSLRRLFESGGHSSSVESVLFSRDGKSIVSASHDRTVRMWDARTGHLLSVLAGHSAAALSTAFSGDGKTLFSGGRDNVIRLWNPATFGKIGLLQPGADSIEIPEPVLDVAVSPDGKLLATAHENKTVRLRELDSGEVVRILRGHEDVVSHVAFSPTGKFLSTTSFDKTARIWRVRDGRLLFTLQGHTNWVFSSTFSPDGNLLATGAYDKTVRLWHVRTGKAAATLTGHSATVRSVDFSPDGTKIASGSGDRTVKIWDVKTRKPLRTLKGHKGTVRAVDFSPDGTQLATASEDRTAKLWSVHSGKELRTLTGHQGMVWDVEFTPKGRSLATAGFDNTIIIWDPATGARRKNLRGHSDVVTSLAFTPEMSGLISGSYDRSIQFWEAKNPPVPELLTIDASPESVRAVDFSQDGRFLAAAGQDRLARVWDLRTGKLVHGGIRTLAFSRDGRRLATGGWDNTIVVWSLSTGKPVVRLDGTADKHDVSAVAFGSKGRRLVSGGMDQTLRVWDIDSGRLLWKSEPQGMAVAGIDVSPDGKTVVSVTGFYKRKTESGRLVLWDIETGKILHEQPGPKDAKMVEFSPDGGRILIGSGDNTPLQIWDMKTRKLTNGPFGFRGRFLPDGRTVAFCRGRDQQILLYDLASQRELATYGGHPKGSYIYQMAVSPDGSVIATASRDRTVKLWPVREEENSLAAAVRGWGTARPLPAVSQVTSQRAADQGEAVYFGVASPDFKHLAVGGESGLVMLSGPEASKPRRKLAGHEGKVWCGAFSPSGKLLATGGNDQTVRIWDVNTAKVWHVLKGHGSRVTAVLFTPDGKRVVSADGLGFLRIWDAESGEALGRFRKSQSALTTLAVTPDGKLLAAAGWSKEIDLWRLTDRRLLGTLTGHKSRVLSLAFSPDGRTLVTGDAGEDRADVVKVWDVPTRRLRFSANTKLTECYAAAFSPEGSLFATGGGDRNIRLWDAQTGKLLATVPSNQSSAVRGLNWSPNSDRLITIGQGGTAMTWHIARTGRLWMPGDRTGNDDAAAYRLQGVVARHQPAAWAATFSPDGRLLATAGEDKTAVVREAGTWKEKFRITTHSSSVIFAEFSPDGRWLATSATGGHVVLTAVETGKASRVLKGHSGPVRKILFSRDGESLITASNDGTVHIWNVATGKLLKTLKHETDCNAIAVSPDGATLAVGTGSWRKKQKGFVTLWNLQTGKRVRELRNAADYIMSLVFLRNGDLAVAKAGNVGAAVWDVKTGERKMVLHWPNDTRRLTLSSDGKQIAVAYGGTKQGRVGIWDVDTGENVARFDVSNSYLYSVEFSPDGNSLVTASKDGGVRLWRRIGQSDKRTR